MIIEDEGGNTKVESKRGKLYREPSHEAEVLDVDDEEPTEADVIAELEADVEWIVWLLLCNVLAEEIGSLCSRALHWIIVVL